MRPAVGKAIQELTAWRTVPLSEVCDFKPSKDIPRNMLAGDADVSFVPMNDLGELVKHFDAKEVRKFGDVVKSYTYFANGDVLCAKITPCFENGKLGVASDLENGVGFGSSEFVVMRPKLELLAEFLYYYLSRDAFRDAGARVMSGAVGHKRVPKEYFEELPIPVPPLEEQKRIVAVLDQAFAALDRARAHAEANLADAEVLRQRGADQLLDRYTGSAPKTLLGDLAAFRNGLNFSRHSSGESVKVAGVGDFKSNFWLPVDGLKSTIIEGRLSDDDRLRMGDILAVRSNGNKDLIGRVMLVGETDEIVSFSGFVIRIRVIAKGLKPEFLCHYMKSRGAVAHLLAGGGGANISNLNQGILSSLPIAIPTLEDQQKFVDSMNMLNMSIEKLAAVASSKLADLANLRQSLLQKAFSGELT